MFIPPANALLIMPKTEWMRRNDMRMKRAQRTLYVRLSVFPKALLYNVPNWGRNDRIGPSHRMLATKLLVPAPSIANDLPHGLRKLV